MPGKYLGNERGLWKVFLLPIQVGFDFSYGLHSNIPVCCALYYARQLLLPQHEASCVYGFRRDAGYLECPSCRQGNKRPNKLHRCDMGTPSCLAYETFHVAWLRLLCKISLPLFHRAYSYYVYHDL